jgi:hypothetical protein
VQIEWTATRVLGVEVDFPSLAQAIGLHEVPLVVHVKAVVDGVIFEVGHEAGNIQYCHVSSLPRSRGCAHFMATVIS